MKVQWSEDAAVEIRSIQELDHLLDDLAAQTPEDRPILVDLIHVESGILEVGIGCRVSVLCHVPASGDPPYLVSLGDEAETGDVGFYGYGEWSEFSREECVPIEVARQAAREFFISGGLSTRVRWKWV